MSMLPAPDPVPGGYSYENELLKLRRRRAMAQALFNGQQPQGQMVGNRFVAPSPFERLAATGKQLVGAFMERRANKEESSLRDKERTRLSDALRGLVKPGGVISEGGAMGGAPTGVAGATGASQPPPGQPVDPRREASLAVLRNLPIEAQQEIVAKLASENLFPKEGDAFTLGRGEKRYSSSGKVIAEGAEEEEKLTDDQREWMAAQKGGYKGSLQDWIIEGKRAGATRVNVHDNKPPPGYRWKADGTLEAIPGGQPARDADKYNREVAESERRAGAKLTQTITSIDNVMGEIDKAAGTKDQKTGKVTPGQVGWWETGFTGSMLARIPGSDSYNLSKTLETIKANIGFDKLQAMRDASPTGGALGQVAIQELNALQNSIASLDQAQEDDQLLNNLAKVRRHYENWKRVVAQANAQQPASGDGGSSAQPPALDAKTRAESYY